MTSLRVAPIVEGHGELSAVPVLLRRIGSELLGVDVQVTRPWRVPKGRMTKPEELSRVAAFMRARVGASGLVLAIVDADDDDPANLSARVVEAAQQPIVCVVAIREFEAWFLAAQPASEFWDPSRAELTTDAKGKLGALSGRDYREVRDQAAFAATSDLHAAQRHSPSFAELVTVLGRHAS